MNYYQTTKESVMKKSVKLMSRPCQQITLTNGYMKLSNFYMRIGLRLL